MSSTGIPFIENTKGDLVNHKSGIAGAKKGDATQTAQIHKMICTWFFSTCVDEWIAHKGH